MKFIQQIILLLLCLYGARDCSIKYLNKSDAENPKEISTTDIYQNNNLLDLPKYFLLKNAFIDVSLTGEVMAKNGGKEYQVNMLIPVYDKQYSSDSLKIIKTKLFIKLKDVGKISESSTYKVMSELIDEKEMAFFRGMSLNVQNNDCYVLTTDYSIPDWKYLMGTIIFVIIAFFTSISIYSTLRNWS
jgi:hypothetical protein